MRGRRARFVARHRDLVGIDALPHEQADSKWRTSSDSSAAPPRAARVFHFANTCFITATRPRRNAASRGAIPWHLACSRRRVSKQTADQTTATAGPQKDEHAAQPTPEALGLGVSKLVAMMSAGNAKPAEIAKLIGLHPREQVAMYKFLQQAAGNGFVQKVIALAKPVLPDNVRPAQKVVDGVNTGSTVHYDDDSAVTMHVDGGPKWSGGVKDGAGTLARAQDHSDSTGDDKHTVTNGEHVTVGNVGVPGQQGINYGAKRQVADKTGDVERVTSTSGDVIATADTIGAKLGRGKEKVVNETTKHGRDTDVGGKVNTQTGKVEVEAGHMRTSVDATGTTTKGVTGGLGSEGVTAGGSRTRVKNVGTNPDGTPTTKTNTTNGSLHAGPESSGASVAHASVGADGTAKSASAGVDVGKEGVSAHAGYSLMTKNGTGVSASVSHGTTVHAGYPVFTGHHWEVQYMRTTTSSLNASGSVGAGGFGASLGIGESAAHFDSGVRVFEDFNEALKFRGEAAELLGPPILAPGTIAGATLIPIGATVGTGNSNAISANGAVSFMGASLGAGTSKAETHELAVKRIDGRHVEVTVVDGKQREKHYGASGMSVTDTKSTTVTGSKAITYRFDLFDEASQKAFEKFCKDLEPPAGGTIKPVRIETLDADEAKETVGVAGHDQSYSGTVKKQMVIDGTGTHETDDGTRSTEAHAGKLGHLIGDKDSHASATLEAKVENGKEKSYTATIEVGGESGARNREALGQYFSIGDAKGTDPTSSGNWTLTADVSVDAVHAYESKLHDFKGKTPDEKRQILNGMVATGGGIAIHDKKPLDWDVELEGDKNFPGASGREELEHRLADYQARVKDPEKAAGVLVEVDKTMNELAHRYVAIHDPSRYTDLPGELRAKVLDQISRQLAQFRFVRERAQTMSIKNGDAIKHSHDPKAGETNTEIVAVQEKLADLNSMCAQGTQALVHAMSFPIHGHRAQFEAKRAAAAEWLVASNHIDKRQETLDGAIEQARSAYLQTADQPEVAAKLLALTRDKSALLETLLKDLTMAASDLLPYVQPKAVEGFTEFWRLVDGLPGSAAEEDRQD